MTESSFLTRMEINPRRRAARKYLGSPQVMHAAVEAAFPAATAGDRRLWRVDQIGEGTYLYLLSPTKPDLSHLVEEIGRPSISQWDTKDYRPLLDNLNEGQVWAFRLTANATHSGKKAGREGTQRFGHVTVAQQQAWLLKRLEHWGLEALVAECDSLEEPVPHINVVGREVLRFGHGHNSGAVANISLARVSYEGLVRITDADLLRKYLVGGMGHAKAYGCGLMTLAHP